MSIFDRRPALRWLAPAAALLVVGSTGGIMAATASADTLPPRSAQQLLVDLQENKVDAMSGTVVQNSNLGIPDLPGLGSSSDASLTSLISGSHTLDVWYASPDKARLRVQGSLDETDVITNGTSVWTWSYKDKTATHRTLSAKEAAKPDARQAPADMPSTPQEAAAKILKALDPTTKVTTAKAPDVAGRPVYELVLEPQDPGSLITSVRIAIDGTEHIPLKVDVLTGADKPAFEVAYTAVDFARPDDSEFNFKAPPGTKVTEVAPKTEQKPAGPAPSKKQAEARKQAAEDSTKIVGKGWSTVVVTKVPADATKSGGSAAQLTQVLSSLPKVEGSWGSGRLLSGTAFSAVLTDDGRLAVGSVKPEVLFNALTK